MVVTDRFHCIWVCSSVNIIHIRRTSQIISQWRHSYKRDDVCFENTKRWDINQKIQKWHPKGAKQGVYGYMRNQMCIVCEWMRKFSPTLYNWHNYLSTLVLKDNPSPNPCHTYASMNRVGISSDNGLSPIRHQAIMYTFCWVIVNWSVGTNFSEILIKIHNLSFVKMHLKISSAKWRPCCPGED